MSSNPWVDRFELSASDSELKNQLYHSGPPLTQLRALSVEHASRKLEGALKQIVVPSAQMITTVRQLAACARAFAELRYPNQRKYLEHVYSGEPNSPFNGLDETLFRPVCLTGLAGVGKSQILSAFQKLMFRSEKLPIPSHAHVPLVTSWHLQVHAGTGLRQLVKPFFKAAKKDESAGGLAIKVAAREALIQGVSLITADELQFQSQSTANTQIAKLLLQLSRLGPPLIYACNYSLVHRLMRRPNEERQRLLANPLVIEPETDQSEDWTALINELLNIAVEFSAIDSQKTASLMHSYTFGIKRSAVLLLCIAYGKMRLRKGKSVDADDLTSAYLSSEYTTTRQDVELLKAFVIGGKHIKEDLFCPFENLSSSMPNNKIVKHPANEQYVQRVSEAALISSLTNNEKRIHDILTEKSSAQRSTTKRQKPAVTAENLLGGAERFSLLSNSAKDERSEK